MKRTTRQQTAPRTRKVTPKAKQKLRAYRQRNRRHRPRPLAAYRQRAITVCEQSEAFNAPETWHEPEGRRVVQFLFEPAGPGYCHPVTVAEVRDRMEAIPARFVQKLEVVQFSRMTRKRQLFPCYGMQWATSVYLYPIEDSLVETYVGPPKPQQQIEAKMYGGKWFQDGELWRLEWTEETIRDFYLNNILIHEIGHIHDHRNASFDARERYANWFAIEYGYRAARRKKVKVKRKK